MPTKKDLYDEYNFELDRLWSELETNRITDEQYNKYRENLYQNLETDLKEYGFK